ncbi:hypothetical protein [Salmonirosea aquatica]|uniref:Uncharacterized protein n=1 Tax=Salmonirosea aquatica TaxID=2654236 RepID=A0A7C9FSP2_9BACT|nr:hypothetical protein [Cytophagaceae bacterium SJW1-29]
MKIWITSILVFLFIGCSKKNKKSSFQPTKIETVTDLDKVAVVLVRIQKKGNNYSAFIPNYKIINSSKIISNTSAKNWRENDFICFILNQNKTIMDTLIITKPMQQSYEFSNDKKIIESKIVESSENELLLRFNYNSNMESIQVLRVQNDNSLKIISTIPLFK